jgi:hypothetical protein
MSDPPTPSSFDPLLEKRNAASEKLDRRRKTAAETSIKVAAARS